MPRAGQIIPEWKVPHVKTYINDNSEVIEEVAQSGTKTRMLCVFTSNKGEEGVIKKIEDPNEFIEEYGTPDFATHGQPMLNAWAALNTGYASCWCLRIAADDAKYSNVVVYANTKVTEETRTEGEGESVTTTTVKHLNVWFTCESANINKKVNVEDADVNTQLDNLLKKSEDGKYPLFVVMAKGSGTSGDCYGVRLTPDYSSTINNEDMTYSFEVLDKSTGAIVSKELFSITFNPDSHVTFMNDVIDDPETGSNTLRVACSDANIKALYDEYVQTVGLTEEDAEVKSHYTDLLFGRLADTVDHTASADLDNYHVYVPSNSNTTSFDDATFTELSNNTELTIANFSALDGLTLKNGSDGSLSPIGSTVDGVNDGAEITKEFHDEVVKNLYKKYFDKKDKKVPALFSKRRTPAELLLDANYPYEVKSQLVELGRERGDCQVILDAGVKHMSVKSILDWCKTESTGYGSFDEWFVSKECQHFNIRDPFTKKIITVTYTYKLATDLPRHMIVNGNHIPYVGESYATLTGHIRNSLYPEIDADDNAVREQLYTNGINFVECIAEDTYCHAIQTTSQKKTTDLSEMNNVAVLLEMKRRLENYNQSALYDFADPDDRARFTEAADLMFTDYRGIKLRDYKVYFDMNEFEAERSILHCYLAVTFRQLAKRGIIEIDINKRS